MKVLSKKDYSNETSSIDFSKIQIGSKKLEDPTLAIGNFKKANPLWGDAAYVLKVIDNGDLSAMREISNFFFRASGIYSRLCRYMAFFYRYDWYVTPFVNNESVKEEKILDGFHKSLTILDKFKVKKVLGEIALKVIRNGCYYGYLVDNGDNFTIQELPIKYCRSRFFTSEGRPAVEFNMQYFDDAFKDTNQKIKILNIFPKEFKKGYVAYKEGRLKPEFIGDAAGWYLLNPDFALKFNLNQEDYPAFMSVIPAIIDLDEAKGLDKKKRLQDLAKIVIQKFPLDKNGDLIFDEEEMAVLHSNACQMLSRAIGLDVLSTVADVAVEDLADNTSTTSTDDLQRVERAIYNEAGVSQMQFNTDGNIALEKSIANDEAAMYNLILQFEELLNLLLRKNNKNSKKLYYSVQILNTTIYNYKDMAKLYKEQAQMGYSKMLPQIALGQSQSSILANAYFENTILDLVKVFIPPLTSNTMNADALDQIGDVGRPEKPDDEKSTKTIQNKESAS